METSSELIKKKWFEVIGFNRPDDRSKIKFNSTIWYKKLYPIMNTMYFKSFLKGIYNEYKNVRVYPQKEDIFNTFKYTDYDEVKVVILGQDPYYSNDIANGLAFGIKHQNCSIPPSLVNIMTELNDDGVSKPPDLSLKGWARQGVLLLNTTLTVREGEPQSHMKFWDCKVGWLELTSNVINMIGKRVKRPVVFMLWGQKAREYIYYANDTDQNPHLFLTAAHPSPLAANKGFFGCKHFSKCNDFLKKNGIDPIDWSV